MSMNLTFENGGDFPFQTPTALTRAVLAEPNTEKRLQLLDEWLKACNFDDEQRQELIQQIRCELANGASLAEI